MKHLYFLRHGESIFNKSLTWTGSSDTMLTNRGRIQAKNAGKKAKSERLKFDLIISSPLSRAHETALIFANEVSYPEDKILLNDNTVERGFGILEGRKDLVAATKYMKSESAIDNYKGVEKLKDLQERTDNFYKYLKSLPYETILLVGHGAFARALRRSVNKEPLTVRGRSFLNAELIKLI